MDLTNKKCLAVLAIFFCVQAFCGFTRNALLAGENRTSLSLNLPVIEMRDKFMPYEEFCQRNPRECKISEPSIIELTMEVKKLLSEVNTKVNFEIKFVLDKIQYGKEEFWAYPISGMGDCEDIVLEKRLRLKKLGIPKGALSIAIVNNKNSHCSHALLLIETTQGTYAMDRFSNEILLWYQLPYNFETRERPDGKWERFDQSIWTFNSAL
jgi:predicted transglutaminase-like cysteine proteinase